jgi:cyclic lactone autoinducer peptide
MKKLIFKTCGVVANLALLVTVLNVNASCMLYAHQPELPKGAEKLRKF